MRLIYADELMGKIKREQASLCELQMRFNLSREYINGIDFAYETACEYIREADTAYDIDKVVEQLEERKVKHEELCQYSDSHYLAVDVLVRAIEIVKGGAK